MRTETPTMMMMVDHFCQLPARNHNIAALEHRDGECAVYEPQEYIQDVEGGCSVSSVTGNETMVV